MRVDVAQLWQETNTFNPVTTAREDFEALGVALDGEVLTRFGQVNELGGFLEGLSGWPERPEVRGLVRAGAWPAGTAGPGIAGWLEGMLLSRLDPADPPAGLLLALHGSMAAADEPDVEGRLLRKVRERLGSTPVVATLDLHAHVTGAMVESADVLVLYHTIPHVDVWETGVRAAGVLRRILAGARPATAWARLPAVFPVERANTQDPASPSFGLRQRLAEMEADPRVLAAGLATVQPWLDVPGLCSAVVVTTDGLPELAAALCSELAERLWALRDEYHPREYLPPAEAVRRARETAGLVVIGDPADATTSGAPGDSVWLLAELLRHDWEGPVLVPLVDPEGCRELEGLPEGAPVSRVLGARRDTRFGARVEVTGELERHFRAAFTVSGHLGRNLPFDMGDCVVVRCRRGDAPGQVRVLLTERTGPHFAPEFFRAAGFDPFAARVVVAKSPCGFRAAYQGRAAVVMAETPGCAPPRYWTHAYRHRPAPLWPWEDWEWSPAPRIAGPRSG